MRHALLIGLTACSIFDRDPLPPRGEALIVVDTDLPVPRVVSRLRIDIATEDGTVVDTRDDVRPDPQDWPTSFSVYSDDENRTKVLLVRLRAYLDARTTGTEPEPSLTVDRTVRVELEFGRRGRMQVLLKGECVGVAGCGADPVPLEVDVLDRNVPSRVGTYASQPCSGAPADRICVPGGSFIFGDTFYRPSDVTVPLDARPEHFVAVSRFVIDEREVSVGRFRTAVAKGFVPPSPPIANEKDGPPGLGDADKICTWSANARDREGYPLSCVTWDTARAFCESEGGDLPTEAQWEWAAVAAGRNAKATYPWGEDPPTCDRAVFARSGFDDECLDKGEGVQPLEANGDVNALGIRDLGGSLEEMLRDDAAPLSDACWSARIDPTCTKAPPPECVPDPTTLECRTGPGIPKSVRGASWVDSKLELRAVDRSRTFKVGTNGIAITGFRCVYPAP